MSEIPLGHPIPDQPVIGSTEHAQIERISGLFWAKPKCWCCKEPTAGRWVFADDLDALDITCKKCCDV